MEQIRISDLPKTKMFGGKLHRFIFYEVPGKQHYNIVTKRRYSLLDRRIRIAEKTWTSIHRFTFFAPRYGKNVAVYGIRKR